MNAIPKIKRIPEGSFEEKEYIVEPKFRKLYQYFRASGSDPDTAYQHIQEVKKVPSRNTAKSFILDASGTLNPRGTSL